jgi:hypothetical protein
MSNQYMLSVKAQGFDAAIEGLQYADNPYPASPCQSDVDWLELLEQQQFETPRQTWCLCCSMSSIPGVEAFVVSRYPDYLSEKEVRQLFAEEVGYPSYWVQKLPVTVNYLYESSGEWEA